MSNPAINELSPQVFDTPGVYNWVVPYGVTSVRVTGYGGGGGAGGSDSGGVYVGGKGGDAEMAASVPVKVTPYEVLTVKVGAGGAGGAEDAAGSNGGVTQIETANLNAIFYVQGGGAGGAATSAANGAPGANNSTDDSGSQVAYGRGAPVPAKSAAGAAGLGGYLSIEW